MPDGRRATAKLKDGRPRTAADSIGLGSSEGNCGQRRLGTKSESLALARAPCGSVLLTCARTSPAEIRKFPKVGAVDTVDALDHDQVALNGCGGYSDGGS